jgi:hypothetical protein
LTFSRLDDIVRKIPTLREGGILAEKDLRINEGIRVREVRLIDADGNQKGIVPTFEALQMAREAGADLVEVAPQAQPPVCKILDYGKYKFELEKKTREAKKHQKLIRIKEIRMQPKIDEHDLDFKTRHILSSARTSWTRSSRCSVTPSSWRSPPRWKGGRCRYC